MKLLLPVILLIVCFTFSAVPVAAASSPSQGAHFPKVINNPASQFIHPQHATARHLSFIQKLKLKVASYALIHSKNARNTPLTAKQARQAKWSLILGIGSFVLLLIPFIGLLSLPAAIAGLVLGIKSLKGNSNTKGLIGVITSAVVLLLLIIGVIALALFFASGW